MKKALSSAQKFIIRRVMSEDSQKLYQLKLNALFTDPEAFLATLEEMKRKTDIDIQTWIVRDYIMGAFAGDNLVATLHLIQQEPQKFRHIGIIGGLYVDPLYRQQGLARFLLEKMMEHIKENCHFHALQLKVVTSNLGAIKLYQAFGFWRWATEEKALFHDGKYWDQYHYQLWLNNN